MEKEKNNNATTVNDCTVINETNNIRFEKNAIIISDGTKDRVNIAPYKEQ